MEKLIEAEKNFDLIFKNKQIPDEIEEFKIKRENIGSDKIWVIKLLVESGMAKSNGEARRLINQGAIKIDGQKMEDDDLEIEITKIDQKIIQKGKRHFRKIIVDN